MNEPFVMNIKPLPGRFCPDCFGTGKQANGGCNMSTLPDGTYKIENFPASDCYTCKGRVKILPID